MARLPDVANVLRLGFSGTINTSPFMVTLHAQYTGPALGTTALNAMCSTWATTWDASFKNLYPSGTALRTVEAWDLTSPAGPYGSANVALAGTLVGGGLANSAALCISWKVNYRWRGGHPRSYLPPPTSAETSNGNLWSVGFQSTAQTQARNFLTAMNATSSAGTTFKLCLVKYIEAGVILPVPKVLLFADALVHNRIDTQRRRLGKEVI